MKPHTTTALPGLSSMGFGIPLKLLHGLLFAAAAVYGTPSTQAAETSASAAAALKVLSAPLSESLGQGGTNSTDGGHSRNHITVQKGESIDAVMRRGLPGLILNEEFLRQALAKANPRIFPKGRTYPVKPGTVLVLPSVESLRQQILLQYPQTAALFQAPAEHTDSSDVPAGPDKRRWVRFP